MASPSSQLYAGVCEQNTDFYYGSDLWHAQPSDFGVRPGSTMREHLGTRGGNRLYYAYADPAVGITHVKVEMFSGTTHFGR